MPATPVPAAIARAITAIEPPDSSWAQRAAERQSRLTMPPGSLGRLLELGQQLAAIQRTDLPAGHPALVAVFAADHGIASAGVSAYPAEVTGQMVANYLRGGAAINVIARRVGAEVRVANLGVAHLPAGLDGLESRPVRRGTSSFLDGPAMTRDEAFCAVQTGLDLAELWIEQGGFRVVALGEMGIGNTTTAAALIAALTGAPAEEVVGRGTGLDDRGLERKRHVVAEAIALHQPQIKDIWDLLARLGGLEILGLAGLALGTAKMRAMVVLDGLISTAAGLIAARLCPVCLGYLVASHAGTEPGHRIALQALGLRPMLDLGLRLGEGTGAAMALPLIATSADLLRDMATFDSAGVAGPVGGKPALSGCQQRGSGSSLFSGS